MDPRSVQPFGEQTGAAYSDTPDNLSEAEALYHKVSEQEKVLDTLYLDLGKQYYAYSKDQESIPAEFCEKLSEIAEENKKIDELNVRIKKLQGIHVCEHCGADTPDDSAFCINCGQRIAKQNSVKCPSCGTENSGDAVFCSACGGRINIEDPTSSVFFSLSGAPVKCSKCGKTAEPDADFCIFCGEPIRRAPAAPAYSPRPASRFCFNCGKLLDADEDFCSLCGAKVV